MREADVRSRRHGVLCLAGFVLSASLAALFIVTLCRTVGYFAEGWTLIGFHGAVVFSFYKGGQGWSCFPFPQPLQFGDIFWRPWHDPKVPIVPLWMPFLAVLVPSLIGWVRSRRPPPGHCACGYDLTGNFSGVCPECGTKVS